MNQFYYGNIALAPMLITPEYSIHVEDLSKWRANWLESGFLENIWKIQHAKSPLDFNARFTNGEYLTNPKYISLLNTIKKIVFLKRSGHLADISGKQTTRSGTQYRLGRDLISFAQYLVNNDLYEEGLGFAGMTKSVFEKLVMSFVHGGRDAVSGHFDMVKFELARLKGNDELHTVLDKNGVFKSKAFIAVTGIEQDIVTRLTSTSKDKLKEFCIFEEHAQSISGYRTEFNNATPLKSTRQENSKSKVEDEDYIPSKISDTALGNLVSTVNTLADFKICLKDSELANYVPFTATTKDYEECYYESRRTPNIPTKIALSYIDSAVSFVHKHGDNLVSALANCREQIINERKRRKSPRRDSLMKSIVVPRNSTTIHFAVERYNMLQTNATVQEKREQVTLELLLEVFQSAVFILLSTFACKRFQDVIPVKQAANTIGYTGINNIKFGLAKADPVEVLRAVGRPVPKVVADAFDNLVEINNLLLDKPDVPSNHLFQSRLILPGNCELLEEGCISYTVLKRRLIQFADFVEIPTVEQGGLESRWYLNRVHMLRRFFACAYYHTQDKKHLPALTWLMGHADTQKTMHYVTQNLSNAEMTSSEAASVIASVISNLDDNETDIVKQLSEAFGENSMGVTLARNERRLEKRVNELINKGHRVVRKISGELVLLETNSDEEELSDVA